MLRRVMPDRHCEVFAALLRRLADRIDPPRAEAPEAGDVRWVSREELRAIQQEVLQLVDDCAFLARVDGRRGDGLLWIPREALESILYFFGQEISTRDRDLATIECDPTTVLR